MTSRHNLWKALTAVIATFLAFFFNSVPSKALTNQAKALSEQTIEERVARIREELRSRGKKITITPDITSPKPNTLVAEANDPNPPAPPWNKWNDWNNWNDWANWNNWNDFANVEPTGTTQSRS